jgi:hypothetical protein
MSPTSPARHDQRLLPWLPGSAGTAAQACMLDAVREHRAPGSGVAVGAVGAVPPAAMVRTPGASEAQVAGAVTTGGSAATAAGLRCVVCGLDEVLPPRTRYCSTQCRRRAAALASRARRRAASTRDGGLAHAQPAHPGTADAQGAREDRVA